MDFGLLPHNDYSVSHTESELLACLFYDLCISHLQMLLVNQESMTLNSLDSAGK